MKNQLKDFKLSTEIYTSNEVDRLMKNLSSDEIHFNENIVGLSGNITSTDYNPNIAGSIAINGVVKTPQSIAIGCKDGKMGNCAIADSSLCCESGKEKRGNAFAFGYNAKAYNYCTFSFGSGEAAGEYAVAMGGGNAYGTQSMGVCGSSGSYGLASFSQGGGSVANGSHSMATGFSVSAVGGSSHAEGGSAAAFGEFSHAEGTDTKAHGYSSHAEGRMTYASGYSSHAEGHSTSALNIGAHSEGFITHAYSQYSHAEGSHSNTGAKPYISSTTSCNVNTAVSYNGNIFICKLSSDPTNVHVPPTISSSDEYWEFLGTDTNHFSHAEGTETNAVGYSSHAEGYATAAFGDYSHAEGYNCIAKHDRSFAWSGNWSQYSSNADGSFNIDPVNGLSGFYIGKKSLAEHLQTAVEYKPLSGKSYNGNTELSTLLFDIINALGGTVDFS